MGRYKKKREQKGLRVDVRGNNVEWALKKMKRMVKDSGQILELKKRIIIKNHLLKEEKRILHRRQDIDIKQKKKKIINNF